MSVTHEDYLRARFIAEEASKVILPAIRPNNRGRKTLDPVIFLTGGILAVDIFNVITVTKIYRVLKHELTLEDKIDLGVLKLTKGGVEREIRKNDLYQFTKRFTKMLDFSSVRVPHLSRTTRHKRRDWIDQITQALINPTLIPRPEGSCDFALDGTGIWASERAPYSISEADLPEIEHEEEGVVPQEDKRKAIEVSPNLSERDLEPIKVGKGQHGASDAGYGSKTNKEGKRKKFYGYDVEALVRVPSISQSGSDIRSEPNLLEKLVVLPASTDIVEPCLRMFDRMKEEGREIHSLLVDRHYSYKRFDRWRLELLRRGIEQVADMHAKDQGYKEWDGALMISGWAHCPNTPKRLAVIPTLGPNATEEQKALFAANISERRAYAAKRINPLDAEGKIRFGCPALDGTVGCPRRAGTEATAIANNLPIIEIVSTDENLPSICTQMSVQFRIQTEKQMIALKMAQKFYWGSREWMLSYARRTYVEGWFGVLKNSSATGFHRGSHQFTGLPMVSLVFGIAAAATNLRLLVAWNEATGKGDITHPLLRPKSTHFGFTELTEEQARCMKDQAFRKVA